jgi:hypothetical protein
VRRALLLLAAAALLPACGEDAAAPPGERPPETAEELPKLPRGWEPHRNAAGGFALGRPPGWAADDRGPVTRLASPDELVAVTITADRTDEALELPPDEFATATLGALPGYREPLEARQAKPFRHPYRAAQARATGVAERSGVRQRVLVVALRRDELATVTAVVAANAERPTGPARRDALRALKTLRTRPVS